MSDVVLAFAIIAGTLVFGFGVSFTMSYQKRGDELHALRHQARIQKELNSMSKCQICQDARAEAVLVVTLNGDETRLSVCLDCPDTAAPAYAAIGADVRVRFGF